MDRPAFIKKFDFRGIYGKDITDIDAYYLGVALAKTIPLKLILIGWDTRESSKQLALHFISGLPKTVGVVYVPTCSIDYITAGSYALDFDLSIMFTGSHNPWNWTGLLMHTKGGVSVQGDLVEQISNHYQMTRLNEPVPATAGIIDLHRYTNGEKDIETLYAKRIQTLIPLEKIKPLKVLVDIGDGSGFKALDLLEKLLPQVTFDRINDRRIYNAASSHTADPSDEKNMEELIEKVKSTTSITSITGENRTYDVGFAFDSDADRVLAIDETGKYLNGSLLGSAIVESFQALGLAKEKVGYAVDCGPSLFNTVKPLQENPAIPVAVGRSIVRGMVMDQKLDIGVENVGHFYLKEFFCTDSGVFAMAVILCWMSQHGALSTLAEIHPDGKREQVFVESSAEQNSESSDAFEQEMHKQFPNAKKITVDGVRYELFEDNKMQSWVAVRKSGYEAIEKYYFGSLDKKEFGTLENIVKQRIGEKKY